MPSVLLSPILLPPDSDTPALGFGLLSPLAPSEVQSTSVRHSAFSKGRCATVCECSPVSAPGGGCKEGVRSGREHERCATRSVLAQCASPRKCLCETTATLRNASGSAASHRTASPGWGVCRGEAQRSQRRRGSATPVRLACLRGSRGVPSRSLAHRARCRR